MPWREWLAAQDEQPDRGRGQRPDQGHAREPPRTVVHVQGQGGVP